MDPRELRIGGEKPRGRSLRQSLQEAPFVVGTAVSFLHFIESIRLENRLEKKQKSSQMITPGFTGDLPTSRIFYRELCTLL